MFRSSNGAASRADRVGSAVVKVATVVTVTVVTGVNVEVWVPATTDLSVVSIVLTFDLTTVDVTVLTATVERVKVFVT